MSYLHTTRLRRGKLPHWEVESGRYFVTVRLADSLPREAVLRLQDTHLAISKIEPRSPQFVALQREYFSVMEKYLDAGAGACLLDDGRCASIVVDELQALADWAVETAHYSIMPNHWHALIVPYDDSPHSLSELMKRVKGRSAKRIRAAIGGSGPVWQREWFDRWMRSEAEWEKTVAYIRQNPVKAHLAGTWQAHRWTR